MAAPHTADRLVAALRAEGCTVREVSGWRTNNRNHKGPWGPVNGVMVHHTVTGPGTDVVGLIFNGHSALPGPLATGCITKDGTVHLTGNGRANHAGGGDPDVLTAVINESYGDYPPPTNEHEGSSGAVDGNARFYGWECENKGDGRDPWPRVQYLAIVKATAGICRAYGWSAKSAIGHLEWSDWKPDPRGFEMKDFRRDLAACLAQPAGVWPDEGQEDDVALTTEDIKLLATKDGIFKAPKDATNYSDDPESPNHYWALGSHVNDNTTRIRRIDKATAAMAAQLGALSAAVTALAEGGGLTAAEIEAAAEAGAQAALDRLANALTED